MKLAADWSAPSAFYWQMSNLDDLDLEKVFLPSRFSDETALYVASPYNPKRIPLVLVHGLKSSPGAFKRLYNELNREPWFRENYQVWFFSYPTGNNWSGPSTHRLKMPGQRARPPWRTSTTPSRASSRLRCASPGRVRSRSARHVTAAS